MENELPKAEVKAETAVAEKVETSVAEKAAVVEKAAVKEEIAQPQTESVVAKKPLLAKVRAVKISKKNLIFIGGVVVLALALGVAYYYKGVFVAATVNGEPISRLSIVRELEKKSGKNALDTIITKKLIENEVKKQGIVVKSTDVDTEIKNLEAQVTAQGGTLEQALAGQGMTAADLRDQITINKELELLLADKLVVSDDEINQYLTANKILPKKGVNSDDLKNQTREQLKGQKFNKEATQFVSDLRAKAAINYFVTY